MKVVEFKGCNTVYAKDQSEYLLLPAYISDDGTVTSCWQLSLQERIKVLFTGQLFLRVLTFNHPLQPLNLSVENLLLSKES